MARQATAQDLLDQKMRPMRPREAMRHTLIERFQGAVKQGASRHEAMQSLFPHTVLDDDVLEHVVSTLLAGTNMLITGPPGSGKTSLAKDIWNLMPKEVWAVDDCPVQDDPFSLVDEAFSEQVPPCPYCITKYAGLSMKEVGGFEPGRVKPGEVPVRTLRLREGHGFARIQGSPEVFPDNLTGAINLAKLEQIGDPNSPLVLEPGKVMQANRGLLLVDEIGKLPRGTQNVLLQALQENIVTPAKSRETFPASFLAITTSNLDDLDNINEPLNDRLSNLYVGFNQVHANNRAIVDMGLRAQERDGMPIPEVLREATVHLIEEWRKTTEGANELLEVGSNRTLLDILYRGQAYALLRGARAVGVEDWRLGALDSMKGRIRARGGDSYHANRDVVESFVGKRWQEAGRRAGYAYWCRFFAEVLKDDKQQGKKFVGEAREAARTGSLGKVALSSDKPRIKMFTEFVRLREPRLGLPDGEACESVFAMLEAFGTFDEEAAGKASGGSAAGAAGKEA